MSWLRIVGSPARVFFKDPRDRPDMAGQGSPHELLRSIGALKSGIEGETPNVSITLRNDSGQCKALFAFPPLGAAAELRDADGVIFSGSVHDIALGAPDATIGIESLLATPLPLRQSTIWGGYREAVPLPHRYGTVSGELIQYNDTRTIFCWADHPCQGIDEVLANGQPAVGWQAYTLVDTSGHAIMVVEFTQPQDEGVTLIARGRAKLHPVTGQLMVNPATVIWDVLANIAGRDVSEADIEPFRRECDRLAIDVGGSIEAADSPQTIARSICASIGAGFCADAPGLARILAGAAAPVSRARFTEGAITPSISLDDMANDLTLKYGYEDGQPAGSVQLEAPDYIKRFGRRTVDIEAKWITSSRVAYNVAASLLGDRARPVWQYADITIGKALRIFDGVTVSHPLAPVTGTFPVLSREVSLEDSKTKITLTAPIGDAPAVRLVRQAFAYGAQQYAGVVEQTVGTDRVYTITEADGTPVVGADVTANGFTRSTDTAGRVAFPMSALPPGSYVLQIAARDGRDWTFPVVVV
jgi:hypothetical protein